MLTPKKQRSSSTDGPRKVKVRKKKTENNQQAKTSIIGEGMEI